MDCCRFKPEAEDNEGARRWRDGSLEEDLPMRTLSEMFNVNYFMVSQTNPHIVPALNLKRRVNRQLGNLLEAEWKHRWDSLTLGQANPNPTPLTSMCPHEREERISTAFFACDTCMQGRHLRGFSL